MIEQLLCQTLSVSGRLDVPIASLACHDQHEEQARQNRRGFRPKGRTNSYRQVICLVRLNVGHVFGGYPFDSCKAISEGFVA